MRSSAVLDSSAIVALFFREEASEKIDDVVKAYSDYHTTSQAFSEVANAAWKRLRIYGEDERLVKLALEKAFFFMINICNVVNTESLLMPAFELAVEKGITAYDALFISLAMKLDVKLITTDRKLYERVKETDLGKFVECV